ncbi:MAG: nitrogenase stabilizing/protective protein NifW [Mangrovicoccus sp.]
MTTSVLDHINGLSSAEDIFTYLLMPFEQEVLNVNRLHIMKRFGQYIRQTDFSEMDEDTVFLEARQALKKAYMDFVESTPLQEKVFKVFTDEAEKYAKRFVKLDGIQIAAAD